MGLLQVMGIEHASQAALTGNLSAMQEVILIVIPGVMGVLADRYGRTPVYVFGLLTTAAGILIGTAGGGWLFARFGPSTPFVLFGFLNAAVCFCYLKVSKLKT